MKKNEQSSRMSRRRFLKAACVGSVALTEPGAAVASTILSNRHKSAVVLVGCAAGPHHRHLLAAVDGDGGPVWQLPLPARGHDIAIRPTGTDLALFGRRPGDYLWVVDRQTGALLRPIAPPTNRVLCGHGVYSADGRRLFTSENDFPHGRGCIGVYAADAKYKRIAELPSHGVGPHELVMLSDGHTLLIANGGILTHPDSGRAKLNLDRMDPNLAWVDSRDGRLLHHWRPPADWHQLSVRHLDVNQRGAIAVAMQYQGTADQHPPLIALLQQNGIGRLLVAPDPIQGELRNYCGSVRWSRDGAYFAVSSPRGGRVTEWAVDGTFIRQYRQTDACGIVADEQGFWVSDGGGRLRHYPSSDRGLAFGNLRWDNHLRRLAG